MTALQFETPRFDARRFETAQPASGTPARPRLRLTRRGRLVLAALVSLPLIAALAAFALLGGGAAVATGDGQGTTYSYVTVQSGESLWSIAQTLDPSADPRDIITAIVDLNQLQTSDVHSGQRLALPPQYSK